MFWIAASFCCGAESKVDNPIVYIVLVVLVIGAVFAVLVVQGNRRMGNALSDWCRE